jgi:hypothetical protein
MPRIEILTAAERLELLAFPEDEGKLIRLYTLTKPDLAFIRQHRGHHNRLGIAVQMSYLQYPGRVLGEKEARSSNGSAPKRRPGRKDNYSLCCKGSKDCR